MLPLLWYGGQTWGPFGCAQGRLFDSVRLTPHFAQDDSVEGMRIQYRA